MLMRLRGGTAPFEIEAGRWKGMPRENIICKQCQLSEIEDVTHWLLRCESQADSMHSTVGPEDDDTSS